jgi:hypothetical protein
MKNVKSKYVKTQFPSVLGYALCSKAQGTSLGEVKVDFTPDI